MSTSLRIPPALRFAVTLLISVGTSMIMVMHLSSQTNSGVASAPCLTGAASSSVAIPTSDDWSNTDLPIQKSIYDGFRPVYVYAMVPPDNGSAHYSQSKQDTLVIKLMESINKGKNGTAPFFVDLAANDALLLSNTYLLEQKGWRGVCIEPNPMYWYRLAAYRTCAIVGAFVGVPEADDGRQVDVVLSNGVFGGIVDEGMDNAGKQSEEKRNLVSINTIFKQTNVPRLIDYLSLDVEGAEFLVMQDFPFDTYTFRFITIERAKLNLKALLFSKGYKLVRMITNFGESLWMHESVNLSSEEIDAICRGMGIGSHSEDPKTWYLPKGVNIDDF